MIVDNGLNEIAKLMTGSGIIPKFIAIGTGSATVTSGTFTLTTETDRNAISTYDVNSVGQVTFISDFSAGEISGTTLTEFGLFNASTGSGIYQKEVIGSQVFDGTNELQVQMQYRFERP